MTTMEDNSNSMFCQKKKRKKKNDYIVILCVSSFLLGISYLIMFCQKDFVYSNSHQMTQ